MPRQLRLVLLLFATCLAATGLSGAGRDLKKEAEIERQLAALDPAAVEPFRRARIAYDANDFATAETELRAVIARVPQFDPAHRRLGASLAQLGRTADGIEAVRRAVQLDHSSDNLATLAYVLTFARKDESTALERRQALGYLQEAIAKPEGQDYANLAMTAQLAFATNELEVARRATRLLEQKAPAEMATHYFAAIVAAHDESWRTAKREILRAGELGLPQETVDRFLDAGVGSRAAGWSFAFGALWTVLGWAGGLLLLFVLGLALSKLTLRHIERANPAQAVSAGERRLRKVYRAVLNGAGVYYYLSLPVVLLLVIGVVGLALYACLLAGVIPIKLMLILGIGALATIWTMGRSLFLKVNATPPGRALQRKEAEGLWRLTEEVAADLHTKPIDEIRITPGTDLCVYERGTWREKLRNRAQRVLVIGAAVLNDFRQEHFRSVLAHEYGHFANRDTAGGDIALRVQNDMLKFYYTMVEAGQATLLNVAFHFLRTYHFLFHRISHGATRLQEVLADRVAAQFYGAAAFEGGLRHVIRQSLVFDAHANREIEDALRAKRPLQNLYQPTETAAADLDAKFAEAINRPTTASDTHPGPMDRFRLVAKVPAPVVRPCPGFVWDLFADRDAIVREMTATVEKNIAGHRE